MTIVTKLSTTSETLLEPVLPGLNTGRLPANLTRAVACAEASPNITQRDPQFGQLPELAGRRCEGAPTALFFPEDSAGAQPDPPGRKLCVGCPVLTECLTWALLNEPYGLWGGMTAYERAAVGGRASRRLPRTGTAAVSTAVKAGVPADALADSITAAHRIARRERALHAESSTHTDPAAIAS